MESLFFYDEQIKEYENNGCCKEIIYYLEKLYDNDKNDKILGTLIGYLWYFLIDEKSANRYTDFNWEFMHANIVKYITIGFDLFNNNIRVCFILGYILFLHWMNIDIKYEKDGVKLLRKASNMDTNEAIKSLASYIVSNRTTNISSEDIRALFPTKSILDKYFIEVL